MDRLFDVGDIFQERLAASLELDKYTYIIDSLWHTDVSRDNSFQRIFNGLHKVKRSEGWRKAYYSYFESIKHAEASFEDIITHLYELTGSIEHAFSSKMLATLSPNKPTWNGYIIQNSAMQLSGKTGEEKLRHVIKLYAEIEKWYQDFMKTEKSRACIREFDRVLPNYERIPNVKKIDCILWGVR